MSNYLVQSIRSIRKLSFWVGKHPIRKLVFATSLTLTRAARISSCLCAYVHNHGMSISIPTWDKHRTLKAPMKLCISGLPEAQFSCNIPVISNSKCLLRPTQPRARRCRWHVHMASWTKSSKHFRFHDLPWFVPNELEVHGLVGQTWSTAKRWRLLLPNWFGCWISQYLYFILFFIPFLIFFDISACLTIHK